VGALAVVKLRLVGIAAVLGEAQLGLPLTEGRLRARVVLVGCRTVGVELFLGLVDALLIAVSAGLFAFGDALVKVDHCLLLVKFALLAGTRFGAVVAHF
jgi:hypothetical protein